MFDIGKRLDRISPYGLMASADQEHRPPRRSSRHDLGEYTSWTVLRMLHGPRYRLFLIKKSLEPSKGAFSYVLVGWARLVTCIFSRQTASTESLLSLSS